MLTPEVGHEQIGVFFDNFFSFHRLRLYLPCEFLKLAEKGAVGLALSPSEGFVAGRAVDYLYHEKHIVHVKIARMLYFLWVGLVVVILLFFIFLCEFLVLCLT